VRESRPPGSVRGASSNGCPYRDRPLKDHSIRKTPQNPMTARFTGTRIILDDAASDEELRARLFAAVSREELVACMDKIGEWVTGKRSDLFHGIVRRHGMLRKLGVRATDQKTGIRSPVA